MITNATYQRDYNIHVQFDDGTTLKRCPLIVGTACFFYRFVQN